MNKPFHILLIEDNPIDAMILKKTFVNINAACSFVECTDGESALEYLEELKSTSTMSWPDVIITDLHLPRMNGHDVLAVIKEDELLKAVPVIMFSSSTLEADIKLAYHLNANSYIIKPLNLSLYKDTIKSFWNFWAHASQLPSNSYMMRKAV